MDPATLAILGGSLFQGLGGLFGASSADKAQQRALEAAQQRWNTLFGLIQPRLGQEAGQGEQMLLQILQDNQFDPDQFFGSEEWNTGQDALMQMLRAEPTGTEELFEAWEPLERRALESAMADAWGQAGGLGQRFGSAMIREEGRVRGEAAENAAARRAQTAVQLQESQAGRQLQAADLLGGRQLGMGQLILQALAQQISGASALAGAEANRSGADAQLLSILAGQPIASTGPSAMPGAISGIGQIMSLLPFLFQLNRPAATPVPAT